MTTTHKIDHYIAGFSEAETKPFRELAALQKYISDLEPIAATPILEGLGKKISALAELSEARKLEAEYHEWRPENRARIAGDQYLKENCLEISKSLYKDIDQRAAKLPGVLASYGKRIADLAVQAFSSEATRESNRIQRDAIESEADGLQYQVAHAKTSVRSFEVSPTQEGFSEALARVAELNFSTPA